MDLQPAHIVVTGASGGIGRALLGALLESFPGARFCATHYRSQVAFTDERVQWQQIDLRNQDAIAGWA